MAFDIPIIIGPNGLLPTPPATLQQQLIAKVAAISPDYTSNLPGSMIEDMADTEVQGLSIMDQAKVDAVNSLTPNAANALLLIQQGSMLGVRYGLPTNTSVPVVFSGTVGYVIRNGFIVGDGSNTYQIQGGGAIGTGGTSGPIPAVAVNPGAFAVSPNTVNQLLTSVPNTVTLSVNNPNPGTPGNPDPETYYSYRSRVQQANNGSTVGSPRLIKTLIGNVPGVPGNLISVQQAAGLKVVVGGSGDPYQVAYAILAGVGNPTILVGSTTTGRNQSVSLLDYPDTYTIIYVVAVAQTVALSVTWNTILSNFTGGDSFQSLVQQPLADYINAIAIGNPINILEMQAIFQQAVAGLLPAAQLTTLNFGIEINGNPVTPGAGTSYVLGDAEGYFTCLPTAVTVTQA